MCKDDWWKSETFAARKKRKIRQIDFSFLWSTHLCQINLTYVEAWRYYISMVERLQVPSWLKISTSKQMFNISKHFPLYLKHNKMKPNFMSNLLYLACNQILQISSLLNLPFIAFLIITLSRRICWPHLLINQLQITLSKISKYPQRKYIEASNMW